MNITWHSAAPERFRLTVFKEGQPLQDPIGPGPWVGAWLWIYSPHTREDEAGWVRAAHGFRRNGKVELRSPVGLLATIEDASDFVEVEDVAPFAAAARTEPLERVEGLGNIPFIGDFFAAPVPGGLLPRSSYAQMALDNAALYTEQERRALYARGMELQPSDEPLNQFVAAAIVPSRTLSYRSDRPYRTGRSTCADVIDQWDTPSQAPFPLYECAADCEEFAQIAFQTAVKLGPPEGYEACLAVVVLSDGTQNVMHAMAMCVDRTWLHAHWDNPDNMDAAKLPHVPLDGVEHSRAIPAPGEMPTHVHYPFLVALLRADGLRILMHKDAVAGVPWENTSVRFVSHCDKEEQQRRRWAGAELVRKYMPAAHAEARAGAGTAGRYDNSVTSVVGKGADAHLREFHLNAYTTADAFIRDRRGDFPTRRGVYDAHFALEAVWGRPVPSDIGGFDYLRETLRSAITTDPNEYTMGVFIKGGKAIVVIVVHHWRRGTEAERDAEAQIEVPTFASDTKLFRDSSFLVVTGIVQPFFISTTAFKRVTDLLIEDKCEVLNLREPVDELSLKQWEEKAREWTELAYESSLAFNNANPRIAYLRVKDSMSISPRLPSALRNTAAVATETFVSRLKLPQNGIRDDPMLQIEVAPTPVVDTVSNQNARLVVLSTSAFVVPMDDDVNRIVVTKATEDEFNPVFFERCLMRIIGSVAGFGNSVALNGVPLGIDRQPEELSSPEGKLRSYALVSPKDMILVPSYSAIVTDVSAAMERTGLARDEKNPDVAIVFHVPISNQLPEFSGVQDTQVRWPIPWRPPAGKYRMLILVVVRDHTNSVNVNMIPFMARQRAQLAGKGFELTGVWVRCIDVSNREARDSAYVAGVAAGLLPRVRDGPDKVVVAQEEKVPAPATSAPAKRSTPARKTIRVAIRVDEYSSVLTKARPYVEHKEDVVTEVFNVLPEGESDLPIVRQESVAKADGVLVFHNAAAEARVEFEHLIAPECNRLRADGAKNLIVIVCRRNEGDFLHSPINVKSETKELLKGIPIFFIDYNLVRPGNEVYLHPANGPRYKQIADAIQTWRGARRAVADASPAAEIVQRPPVRAEPPVAQRAPPPVQRAPSPVRTAAPVVDQPVVAPEPVQSAGGTVVRYRIVTDEVSDTLTLGFATTIVPKLTPSLGDIRLQYSPSRADGVLYFHRVVDDYRIMDQIIMEKCRELLGTGVRNVAVILCVRNTVSTLTDDIAADRYEKLFGDRVRVFKVDVQGNAPNFLWHPGNGPRYEAIAEAVKHWTDVDVPVGASAAAQPDAHVRPAQQLAPAQADAPVVGRPLAAGEIVYAIVNDPTGGMVKRGIASRITGEQKIPTRESRGEQTDFLIVFAEKNGSSWEGVRHELSRAMGEWNWRYIMFVAVHASDEKDSGDFPDYILDAMDFTGDLMFKDGAIRDRGSFDMLLDRMARWITLTFQDAASADDALVGTVPLPGPDNGRPVVRATTPEPDNGRPYVASPFEPDNGPLATYGDTDSEAEFQQFVDEATRLVGTPTPPVVPRAAPRARPRAASLGSLRTSLRPLVVPIPAAPAALAPIAEYDPFDDAYDGGHAMHMHYSALGRALAARLSAE